MSSEVFGTLKMRTFLSGMPECKLGLNDKVRAVHAVLVLVTCCACCACCGLRPVLNGMAKSKLGLNDKVCLDYSNQLLMRKTCKNCVLTDLINKHPTCLPTVQRTHPRQVLFEAQGRNNRQKVVEMEDIRFHQCVRLVSHPGYVWVTLASLVPHFGGSGCIICQGRCVSHAIPNV